MATTIQTILGRMTLPPTPKPANNVPDLLQSVSVWTRQAQQTFQQLERVLTNLDTSQIPQTPTGLYWSQALFDAAFAAKTTDDLAEGVTNLYFTTARARASISATAPLQYDSVTGIMSIPQADATTDGFLSAVDWASFDSRVLRAGDTMTGNLNFIAPALIQGDGVNSIAPTDRLLFDSNGDVSLDWENRDLIYNTFSALNWRTGIISDQTPQESIRWLSRELVDNFGVNSVNWRLRNLRSAFDVTSVDWEARQLFNSGSDLTIDWQNRILQASTFSALDWSSGAMNDSTPQTSILWFIRQLLDATGAISLLWNDRTLIDPATLVALSWGNRLLVNAAGLGVIDWENRLINGDWTVNGDDLIFAVSSTINRADNSVSINPNSEALIDSGGVTTVDWGTGTGSLALRDNSGNTTVRWGQRALFNSAGSQSLNWETGTLTDSANVRSADWVNRELHDTADVMSVDWAGRALRDNTDVLSVDWQSRRFRDTANTVSLHWDLRNLIASDGTTTTLNWESLELTGGWTLNGNSILTTASTGSGNLSSGSLKIILSGTPVGSVFHNVSIDVDEAQLTLNNIGGTLGATKGGTGQTTVTTGDLLYGSAANTWSKLADIATGNALLSGGVGVAPAWGKIGLTTHVTGTLPATNGGTGTATVTTGDLLYGSAANTWSKLADVATGNALISGGVGVAPSWGKIALTTHISGTLPVANGGTGVTTFGGTNRLLYTTAADTLSAITTANTSVLVTNGSGVPSWSRQVDCDALILPATTGATVGVINIGGTRAIHNYTAVGSNNNFFVGLNSGNFTHTGSFNIGLGTASLLSLTSGSYNLAIGASALISNQSGSENVGVGVSSLQSLSSGGGNTAVGYATLVLNETGAQNVAIGEWSQYYTTGSQNVSIGDFAAHTNITGSNNTWVGHRAGYTDGTTATPNNLTNSTAIGNLAQVTLSNCLVLGGVNGNEVNVGIGIAGPTKRLDVAGDIQINKVGGGHYIKEGTNATMGTATLVAGAVVVSTTKVTANSRIFLTVNGGTLTNVGAVYVSARTAGTSFTITSLNILDTSNVAWHIIEPA